MVTGEVSRTQRQGFAFDGKRRANHRMSLGALASVGALPNLLGSMLAEYLIITASFHLRASA